MSRISVTRSVPRDRPPPLWASTGAGAALGLALSWSQAPHSYYPLLLIVLPLIGGVFETITSWRRAAVIGWGLGFGYFMPGLLWIGEAFFVDADQFAWMAPFAVTLLPAGLALFWAAAFAAAFRLGGSVWALAFAWAGAEFLRGHILTGFPWGLFAYAWIDTPVAQTAAWIGPYGLNLLTILVGLMLARGLIGRFGADAPRLRGPNGRRERRLRLGFGLAAAALLALGWGAGSARLPAGPAAMGDERIRIVQPNIPQAEKWRAEYVQRNFDRLMALSEPPPSAAAETTAAAAPPPALILWPETAVTPDVIADPRNRAQMMARLGGARLILGTIRWEQRPGASAPQALNSLFALSPSGAIAAIYDKHHLVPFGEYIPFQETMEALGLRQLAGGRGGFATGPGPGLITAEGFPRFGALICYEAIFPQEMPRGADRPDVLIQITNDAWFGASSGPYQHLAQAQMRAIEQGLPLLRSANTGVSAAIDAYGRVYAHLPLGEIGRIDVALPAPLAPTLYAQGGEAGFYGLMLGLAVIGGVSGLGAASARVWR